MKLFGLLAVLATALLCGHQQADAALSLTITCGNGFDAYLVIDHSRSTGDNFGSSVRTTAENFFNFFKDQPDFRMAIEVFGSTSQEMLPIKDGYDRDDIEDTIAYMEFQASKLGTHSERGFEAIYYQMLTEPRANNKIVFFITDGINLGPDPETIYWADKLRSDMECIIFSFGVTPEFFGSPSVPEEDRPKPDPAILNAIANPPPAGTNESFVTMVSNFGELEGVFKNLRNSFECMNISAILPGPVCAPWTGVVTILGQGFSKYQEATPDLTAAKMKCKYDLQSNDTVYIVDVEKYVDDGEVHCAPPPEPLHYDTVVELSVDYPLQGFTQAGKVIRFYPFDDPICVPAAFPWWILLAIIPLLLFLIWFFFPRLPKKKKFDPVEEEVVVSPEIMASLVAPLTPTAPALPPPEMPPPKTKKRVKKWAKVDTTHYIWSRDGGTARPMECNWGASGAPESAPVKKGDMIYEVEKEPEPVYQEPQVEIVMAAAPVVVPPPVAVVDEGDFEDLEWDRCCGGHCRSSACDPCKRCMSSTFLFFAFLSGIISSICYFLCRPFTPCLRAYQWCDAHRPRPDCCGVGKDGEQAPGQEMTSASSSPAVNVGGALPAGWEAIKDDSGGTYFYNEKSDTSQWDRPT